jgi:hypothetical protein
MPGLPKGNWVSWVEASRYDAATAYATIDRHTYGDMGTYLYRTSDYGTTWTQLVSPQTQGVSGYAHVIREDTKNPKLLFLGTEFGLWISLDGGASWAAFKPEGFPSVPVRDMVVAERDNDLVIATHGRGIWIVDDLSPLRAMTPQTLDAEATFLPGRPVQQRIAASGGWAEGDAAYDGANPANGAQIDYYLKSRAVIGKLTIEILDASGKVVDTIGSGKRKGLNRVDWSMRTKPPQVPPAAQLAGASTEGERVLPGTYTVRLTRAGHVTTMPLTVGLDRRATYTIADRTAQYDQAERVKALFARMSALVAHLVGLREQSGALAAKLPATDPLQQRLAQFSASADDLRKLVVATKEGGAITGEMRLREKTDDVYGAVTSTEGAPPAYVVARIDALDRELTDVEGNFTKLSTVEMPSINDALKAKALPPLTIAQELPAVDTARGGPVESLFAGMLGARFYGTLHTEDAAERD